MQSRKRKTQRRRRRRQRPKRRTYRRRIVGGAVKTGTEHTHANSKSKSKSNSNSNSKSNSSSLPPKETEQSKTFTAVNCAPSPDTNAVKKYSCYTTEALRKLRDLWNARHPDDKIVSEEPHEIWQQLKTQLQSTCGTETCWLKQQFAAGLDKKTLAYTFAPTSPKSWNKNPNEWLSSVEINNVMKQYEHSYPCFEFIGPSPIDFDTHLVDGQCVWEDLCEFSLEQRIKQKKFKFGIIFNTDPHDKGGSHWISLFINVRKKFILYFDSNGRPPPKEVKGFIERVREQAKTKLATELRYIENTVAHQQGNTECGMYSLYMIISLLKEGGLHSTYNDFISKDKRIQDKDMEILRHKLFNFQSDD